jgi:hypothetical protein
MAGAQAPACTPASTKISQIRPLLYRIITGLIKYFIEEITADEQLSEKEIQAHGNN